MHVKVFGWSVKVQKRPLDDEAPGLAGYFHPVKKLIALNEKQNQFDQDHTLIHEMVHAMSYRLGYRQWMSQQLEESMCENIATLMMENFDLKMKRNK